MSTNSTLGIRRLPSGVCDAARDFVANLKSSRLAIAASRKVIADEEQVAPSDISGLAAGMEKMRSPSKVSALVPGVRPAGVAAGAAGHADSMYTGGGLPSHADSDVEMPTSDASDRLPPNAPLPQSAPPFVQPRVRPRPSIAAPRCTAAPGGTLPPKSSQEQVVYKKLKMSGKELTREEWDQMVATQRTPQNLWCSKWLFPSRHGRGEIDPFARDSVVIAPKFVCHGIAGCQVGDCLAQCESFDVMAARQSFRFQLHAHNRTGYAQQVCYVRDELERRLRPAYDRNLRAWGTIPHALDNCRTVYVCIASYAVLVGATCSQFVEVKKDIVGSDVRTSSSFVLPVNELERQKQESLDRSMLRAYVRSLVLKHEANPAPGARQDQQTFINKASWDSKWKDCVRVFGGTDGRGRVPGNIRILQQCFIDEKRLVERKACSHSKCDWCKDIEVEWAALQGDTSPEACKRRGDLMLMYIDHMEQMSLARTVLDDAGYMNMTNPRYLWCLMADAATQRNFEMPKLLGRRAKALGLLPFFCMKLMATYTYNGGFMPFLVHDSQTYGANITWTVIWLSLVRLRKKFGFWPQVLHVQLDNTSGENKNATTLAICSWLVATGRVAQVRVFFLEVGHTHIVIDQIFGVVTTAVGSQELLLPKDLVACVDTCLAKSRNKTYDAWPTMILHSLFDMKGWGRDQMGLQPITRLFGGNVADANGSYSLSGMHDFLFAAPAADGEHCRMQYREHCTDDWLPATGIGALTITTLPATPPKLQEIKPRDNWAKHNTNDLADTLTLAMRYATAIRPGTVEYREVEQEWAQTLRDIPPIITLLKQELRLKFEMFEQDVPLLGCHDSVQAPDKDADALSKDLYLQAIKRAFFGARSTALAIDPVISDQQTKAQYESRLRALQLTLRCRGPTVSRMSAVLNGELVFATSGSADHVSLFKVITLGKMQSPTAVNLQVHTYTHTHTHTHTRSHTHAYACPDNALSGHRHISASAGHTHTAHTHTAHTSTHTHTHTGHVPGVRSLAQLGRERVLRHVQPQDGPKQRWDRTQPMPADCVSSRHQGLQCATPPSNTDRELGFAQVSGDGDAARIRPAWSRGPAGKPRSSLRRGAGHGEHERHWRHAEQQQQPQQPRSGARWSRSQWGPGPGRW